jgi:hypothetical protein
VSAEQRRKVRALAATFGYLEARIDIAEVQGRAETSSVARDVYRRLAEAFPEAEHVVSRRYFEGDGQAQPEVLEPPC